MIKKSNSKETVKRPIKKAKVNHAITVAPVHLPAVVEQKKKTLSFTGLLGWITLMLGATLIVGGVVFKMTSLYQMSLPRPLVCTKCAKLLFRVKVPEPVVVEPEPIPENVVALVGDEQITIEEVHEFVDGIPQLQEVPFEQVYPKMLDLLINNKVVMQGAADMGILEHPEIQKVIKITRDQIITQAYLSQLLDRSVTQQDLQELYDEQVKAFQPQDEIRARHILLATEEQARDTLIQLQAGADFASLANQKSLDKNAPDGELGYFTKDMMIPEFAEAVFAMQKGELSKPVRTAFGWHIIQVEDRRQTQPPSFESQKDQLRQAAMERKLPQILEQERRRRSVRILRPTVTAQ